MIGNAEVYLKQGNEYFEKGQYDEAILNFNRTLEIIPEYAEAYVVRGKAYNKKGKYDHAIKDFNRALEIIPEYYVAYLGRGDAYKQKGQHDKAKADYNRAYRAYRAFMVMNRTFNILDAPAPKILDDPVPKIWDHPVLKIWDHPALKILDASVPKIWDHSVVILNQFAEPELFFSMKLPSFGLYNKLPKYPLMLKLPSLTEIVKDELEKLSLGQILFNPSEEMQVGVKERVEVRIAKTIAEDLSKGLIGRGVPQIEEIKVGTFMKVRLTGDNFDIKALSHEDQLVEGEGFTQWDWDIVPLKSGIQSLLLTVTVRIKIPKYGEENKDHPVFERQIKVKVNLFHSSKHFTKSHWQWIVSTIIGSGIIGYLVKNWLDQK